MINRTVHSTMICVYLFHIHLVPKDPEYLDKKCSIFLNDSTITCTELIQRYTENLQLRCLGGEGGVDKQGLTIHA